jgi:sugar phosphate permease
LLYSGFVLA